VNLGEEKINERLPLIREVAQKLVYVDAAKDPIPIAPAAHYSMGGIRATIQTATPATGLFAAGECACVSVHGANRLGGNSLLETLVFGARAGKKAAQTINKKKEPLNERAFQNQSESFRSDIDEIFGKKGE
jgi:succinate dehydrogenase/fumarate reductase flavoprotein subunit